MRFYIHLLFNGFKDGDPHSSKNLQKINSDVTRKLMGLFVNTFRLNRVQPFTIVLYMFYQFLTNQ